MQCDGECTTCSNWAGCLSVEKREIMNEEIKKVLFEIGASHAILASEEYDRDVTYNDAHWSAVAERMFIDLMNKHDLMMDFIHYSKEFAYKNNRPGRMQVKLHVEAKCQ